MRVREKVFTNASSISDPHTPSHHCSQPLRPTHLPDHYVNTITCLRQHNHPSPPTRPFVSPLATIRCDRHDPSYRPSRTLVSPHSTVRLHTHDAQTHANTAHITNYQVSYPPALHRSHSDSQSTAVPLQKKTDHSHHP